MRIDPAQSIEMEIADLKKQIADLKMEYNNYVRII